MFTSDYLKLPPLWLTKLLTVFKNMTIILVEIVRTILDAFLFEKSTICQRNISPLTLRVGTGAKCSSDWPA